MLTAQNTLSISDLRKNTLEVLEKLDELEEPLTVFLHSKPVAVLMSIPLYTKLQQNADSNFEDEKYINAWDFLINPPEEIRIKKKGLDAVKLIRNDRD